LSSDVVTVVCTFAAVVSVPGISAADDGRGVPALVVSAVTPSVGQRGEIPITLEGADAALPVLVTATTEGRALEVVQARPQRDDGLSGTTIVFRLRFVALAQGTTILRVRAWSYRCDAGRCHAFQTEARVPLAVSAR
jgi:hypothetical protein